MPNPSQGVYKKPEPDVLRLKNKIMEIMRSMGGAATIMYPEWLGGATAKDFKTVVAGSLKADSKQTMWRARGEALCTLKFGANYWIMLKLAGPSDESLSFEISTPMENIPKEVLTKVDATTVEHMLSVLIHSLEKSVKEIISARKAYVKL